MSVQTIDAKMLQKMFLAGAKGLEAKKEYINELNVFPVPDGDTGTNMTMTIMAAAKDVANLQNPTLTELGDENSGIRRIFDEMMKKADITVKVAYETE